MTIKPTVIVSGNSVKQKSPTMISLLEGPYDNKNKDESLRECGEANITHRDKPLRGFL
jgi:hypothetical protein